MASRHVVPGLLALIVATAGCPKKDAAPAGPPSLLIYPPSTAHGESVPCGGRLCASDASTFGTTLVLNGEGLKVTLRTAPKNVVELAGQKVTVTKEGEDATFDMLAKVTELDVREDALEVPVSVTSPGGQTVSDTVRLSLAHVFRMRLAKIAEGPIAFAGDTKTDSAGKLIYVITPNLSTNRVVGEGRIRDIDLVAVETGVTSERGKPCAGPKNELRLGYGSQGGGFGLPRTPETTVSTMKVYDRRKGSVVAENTIRGKMPDCPDAASLGSTLGGQNNVTEIDTWLKTLLLTH